MKVPAMEVLNPETIEKIRDEIAGNDGHEVSFVANVNRDGIAIEVQVMSYGNANETPVVVMDSVQGGVVIHNHPSGELTASGPDLEFATLLANRRIGFYIVDNECQIVNVINKPQPPVYLNEEEVENIFHSGGILSKCISGFEAREEQIAMVRNIITSVNEQQILLCEAGTGTGKSLAYLVPSVIWAAANKKRVLVATYTINLQQQIAHKDMTIVDSVVRDYTGNPVRYAVLMGKRNYVCKRKLYEILKDRARQMTLFADEETEVIFNIERWIRNADEGTRSEYGDYIREEIWEEVNCDSLNCKRKQCKYYGDCFYFKARLQAEESNVIIANHSLVFTSIDEDSYKSVLPFFSGVVFDEAHHIEDVALKSLSSEFSVQGILYHLHKLIREKKGTESGLLPLLEIKGDFMGIVELREAFISLADIVRELKSDVSDAYYEVSSILEQDYPYGGNIGVDQPFKRTKTYHQIKERFQEIFVRLNKFIRHFRNFADKLDEATDNEEIKDIIRSIIARNSYFEEFQDTYQRIFETENDPAFVTWIEATKKNLKFSISPLEVGDFLSNSIFAKKDFTVFTSATLMINKKFDYFTHNVGLNLTVSKEKGELSLPSSFNYREQAEIFILNEELTHSRLEQSKIELVKEVSLICRGGVLVLFTSYSRLRDMYEMLKDVFMENGLLPLKQGEKSRNELLEMMKTRSYVVLFATSSFWEGIDIQGDNLRCVIIEKLPFDHPTDPIYKAKVDLLESRGINSFMTYSVPRAVLRLKQGIGRLIRSKTDRGVIILMDNRIRTKRYGEIFMNSLPPAPVVYNRYDVIIRETERFFSDGFSPEE